MHIIVCVKQVPDTTDVRIDSEQGTLIREGVPSIVNPFDLYAIEEGVRLKERYGGRTTAITMGPFQARNVLKEAVAMGCDEGILLSDLAFAGADTWATSYTLAQAILRIGTYDIIVCGQQAADGDTGQVGPGLATQLDINQLTYISKICKVDTATKVVVVERQVEEGREVTRSTLPCLLTVTKEINEPRCLSLPTIHKANHVDYPIWTAADLCETTEADTECFGLIGSPTRVTRVFTPPLRESGCEMISADSIVQTAEILAERVLTERTL